DSELGTMYYQAMQLAGKYAYAGRDVVINQVLDVLGAKAMEEIHNHHNYAWKEVHSGKEYIVVRKGATPAAPGQKGFVGGSMGEISGILQGGVSEKSGRPFYSTEHAPGRTRSGTKAAGRCNWKKRKETGAAIPRKRSNKPV